MMVTTGSINLLLLIAAVLWLTPIEGTPWSLDAVIFARPRPPRSTAAPAPEQVQAPAPARVPDSAPIPAEAPTAELSPAGTGTASLSASHGE
jgi:hypothetical protein